MGEKHQTPTQRTREEQKKNRKKIYKDIAGNFHPDAMPHNSFRGLVVYIFITMVLLYILYSNLLLSKDHKDCMEFTNFATKIEAVPFNHTSTRSSNSQFVELKTVDQQRQVVDRVEPTPAGSYRGLYDTELKHIAFGVAASSNFWDTRKEYIKAWWRPNETRGVVWMDKKIRVRSGEELPEIRVSQDTSRFKYINRQGSRSALRISRVVSETLKLGMKGIRWFVMGDDDTVFVVENVVRVLSKYDHTQFYYVGSASESHIQNIFFSYAMAFGGGGFAISYPLAKELATMQDKCIQRYPALYGSDDRIQACMAELGVPLTRELGFHQVKTLW